jgi:5-oxoprolinase (ATP-hydrolysing) subunit A
MIDAGRAAGLRVAAEGFADRAYEPDGSLTPRSRPGAVIHDPAAVVARAVRMAGERVVLTAAGREVPLRVDTICVHGDTPGAHELTKRIREALQAAGATVAPIGGWL